MIKKLIITSCSNAADRLEVKDSTEIQHLIME